MKKLIYLCFSFRSSITRSQYLLGMLIAVLSASIFYTLVAEIRPDNQHGARDIFAMMFSLLMIVDLPVTLFMLTVLAVKRLRDIGWVTWLAVINFIPPLSLGLWLLLLLMPSKVKSST